ncbi:MAG TPA: epimerase, partial [Deltaproteobacteria bacterium]|nr:epimerase [Deltaproteobacteria bacterium]
MSDFRLLVFGATGYTGRHVAQDACKRGLPVVAHLRPGSPRASTVGADLEACGAELAAVAWDAPAIRALVQRTQPTHVFLLLGITRAGARRESARTGQLPTYAQVDTGYTNLVLDSVEATAPSARVVYLSSLGADRPSSNAYLQARHVVETRLVASEMQYTIVRPSFISGSDRDEDRLGERGG